MFLCGKIIFNTFRSGLKVEILIIAITGVLALIIRKFLKSGLKSPAGSEDSLTPDFSLGLMETQ